MKTIYKFIAAFASAIILASCNPVYADSFCSGPSELAAMYSKMQYYNEELVKQGKEPRFSKDVELNKIRTELQSSRLAVYEIAVEYGFSNPSNEYRDQLHIWKMMYSQCQHWLFMNNQRNY